MYFKKCLHFSSAAKKVRNQIWVGRISHVHQKCVLTLTLCVYHKCVRFFRKRCHADEIPCFWPKIKGKGCFGYGIKQSRFDFS